jgi:hypothetical protein
MMGASPRKDSILRKDTRSNSRIGADEDPSSKRQIRKASTSVSNARRQISEYLSEYLSSSSSFAIDYSIIAEDGKSSLKFVSYTDLFLWAAYHNHEELAFRCWKLCACPVRSAILAACIFHCHAQDMMQGEHHRAAAKTLADKYEGHALGILKLCGAENLYGASEMVELPVAAGICSVSLIDLAGKHDLGRFIAHDICQRVIWRRWYGLTSKDDGGADYTKDTLVHRNHRFHHKATSISAIEVIGWVCLMPVFAPLGLCKICIPSCKCSRKSWLRRFEFGAVRRSWFKDPRKMLRSPLFYFTVHLAFQVMFLFAYGYSTMAPYKGRNALMSPRVKERVSATLSKEFEQEEVFVDDRFNKICEASNIETNDHGVEGYEMEDPLNLFVNIMVFSDGCLQLYQWLYDKKRFWTMLGANSVFWGSMLARLMHCVGQLLLYDERQIVVPRVLMSVANVLFLFRFILFGSGKEKALTPIMLMTKTMSNMLVSFVLFILICVVGFGVSLAALRHPSGFDREHYTTSTAVNDIMILPYWMIQGEMHWEEFDPEDSCNHAEYVYWQTAENTLTKDGWIDSFLLFDPCVGPFIARFLVVLYMLLVGVMLVNLFVAMMTIEYSHQYAQQDVFYCTLMHSLVSDYSSGARQDMLHSHGGDAVELKSRSQEEINLEKHHYQLRTTAKSFQSKYLATYETNTSDQATSNMGWVMVEKLVREIAKKGDEDKVHSQQVAHSLQLKIERLEQVVRCSSRSIANGSGRGTSCSSVEMQELAVRMEQQHLALTSLLSGSMMNLMMGMGADPPASQSGKGPAQEGDEHSTTEHQAGDQQREIERKLRQSAPARSAMHDTVQQAKIKARQQVQTLMQTKKQAQAQSRSKKSSTSKRDPAVGSLQSRLCGSLHLDVPTRATRGRSPSEPPSPCRSPSPSD